MRILGVIVAIAMSVASACGALPHTRREAPLTSVCEIISHPKDYIGKTVLVSATRVTVVGYEDYLIDKSCSGPNILGIGEWASTASVREYERAKERECAGSGLCTLSAKVKVELTVEIGESGHLSFGPTEVGRLRRVLSFQFVPN
jgi:hypothetical protein